MHTPPLRTQPSPSKNPSRIIHQLNRQIFALFLPLTCLGVCACVRLCVCACICTLVCVCVCAYWSVRHQFACIRNSFPLVIESLDKLSTAAAFGTFLPSLSLSLSPPFLCMRPNPSTARPVMQINERVVGHPLPLFSISFSLSLSLSLSCLLAVLACSGISWAH